MTDSQINLATKAVQAVTTAIYCEQCGGVISPEPENVGKQRFCSDRCRVAWHRAQRDLADGTDGIYCGKVFQVSFRNANIRAKSLKDGMKYEFAGEITEDDFDLMRAVDLTGSVFEAQIECIEVSPRESPEVKSEKPKGGGLAQSAGVLCATTRFQEFLRAQHADLWAVPTHAAVDAIAADVVRHLCAVASRSELDHNVEAGRRFRDLMAQYRDWQANA